MTKSVGCRPRGHRNHDDCIGVARFACNPGRRILERCARLERVLGDDRRGTGARRSGEGRRVLRRGALGPLVSRIDWASESRLLRAGVSKPRGGSGECRHRRDADDVRPESRFVLHNADHSDIRAITQTREPWTKSNGDNLLKASMAESSPALERSLATHPHSRLVAGDCGKLDATQLVRFRIRFAPE